MGTLYVHRVRSRACRNQSAQSDRAPSRSQIRGIGFGALLVTRAAAGRPFSKSVVGRMEANAVQAAVALSRAGPAAAQARHSRGAVDYHAKSRSYS